MLFAITAGIILFSSAIGLMRGVRLMPWFLFWITMPSFIYQAYFWAVKLGII